MNNSVLIQFSLFLGKMLSWVVGDEILQVFVVVFLGVDSVLEMSEEVFPQ